MNKLLCKEKFALIRKGEKMKKIPPLYDSVRLAIAANNKQAFPNNLDDFCVAVFEINEVYTTGLDTYLKFHP